MVGHGITHRPAVGGGDAGCDGFTRGERGGSGFDREARGKIGEIAFGRAVVVGAAALQVHDVGGASVPAGPVELLHQRIEAFVQRGIGHALVAAEPDHDAGVIAIARDGIGRVGEE